MSSYRYSKYMGGVLLPDGRVLLVPYYANHLGLYDAGGTRNGAAFFGAALRVGFFGFWRDGRSSGGTRSGSIAE